MSEKWEIGELIEGRYEIHDIKRGGMGIVFLCYDYTEKMPVAIKTFQDKYLMDKDMVDRFTHEASSWVDLEKHKNIVRAHYVQNIGHRLYIFLEYVTGDEYYGADLTGWIAKRGIDLKTALYFAIQFCDGMMHAEKKFKEMGKSFIHRDIKPANVMITTDKVVKVTDFGLVKTFIQLKEDIDIGSYKDESGIERLGFSKVGSICGTPPYMSPEQCRGDAEIDVRSDIYSFGCVFYEMITGQPPFQCLNFDIYRAHHLKIEPQPITKTISKIPDELNRIVMKCLKKNQSERFSSFKELRKALSEVYRNYTGEALKEETQQELEIEEMINRGVSLGNLGRYQEEIYCLDKVLEINSDYAKAWNNKGFALHALDRHHNAINCFNKALEINSRLVEAWNNKGFALEMLDSHEEAIDCYNRALEIEPKRVGVLINKGFSLCKLGKYSEEIDCYDNALKIDPNCAEAWSSKGAVLTKIGKYRDAIDAFQRFIEIAPVLKYAAQIEQAKQVIKELTLKLTGIEKTRHESTKLDKKFEKMVTSEIVFQKGVDFVTTSNYQDALKCFDEVLEITPNSAEAWNNKGFVLATLGRNEEAIECCAKAIEIKPYYADPWDIKARCLYKIGRYEETYKAIKKFIEFAPPEYGPRVQQAKQALAQLETRFMFKRTVVIEGNDVEEGKNNEKRW